MSQFSKKKFKLLLILILAMGVSSPVFALDLLKGEAAKRLFSEIFKQGGDIYCTAHYCKLSSECTFNKLDLSTPEFSCTINNEIQLDLDDSQSLFRSLYNSAQTADGNCTAHYCKLVSVCEYWKFGDDPYICEIK